MYLVSALFLMISIHGSFSNPVFADEQPNWTTISDPVALRELVSGRALDGKYWKFYFRDDGIMGYSVNDFPSVRSWSVTDDGRLCYSVYGMPERVIKCHRIQHTEESPPNYRFKSETEEFPIEFSEPPKELVDVVNDRAGAE